MTLILGTQSEDHLTVSADGISTGCFHSQRFVGRTTLQKLFICQTFIIAHFGKNAVKTKENLTTTADLINSWVTEDSSISPDLVESFCNHCKLRLGQASLENGGFWLCGFNEQSKITCFRISLPLWDVIPITAQQFSDGSGSNCLPSEWNEHRSAYDIAVARQQEMQQTSFGGYFHQATLRNGEANWIVQPYRGSIGVCEILPAIGVSASDTFECTLPRKMIVAESNRLKSAIFARTIVGAGNRRRRASNLVGARENWQGNSNPDWNRLYQLVAIADEAEHAKCDDVSQSDAFVYQMAVRDTIESLPPEVLLT